MISGLMFLSIVIDYFLALGIEGCKKKKSGGAALYLGIDVLVNCLIFFLFVRSTSLPEASRLRIDSLFIPTGAAFYALKNISYVYDVYSGRCEAEHNPLYLFTYGIAYPFLLAGPAVRYGDISPQLRERKLTPALLSRGIKSFAFGFGKTVILLPVLEKLAEGGLHSSESSLVGSVCGMLAWFGAAWFGFTGLSDMGSGIACMNGFDVPLNYMPLSSRHLLGGLVKCYNTSMVQLAEDIRGNGAAAPILTVLLSAAAACFYSGSLHVVIIGVIAGIMLAGEYLAGYEKIESIPGFAKAVLTFIAAFILFSPCAFSGFSEWKSWLGNIFSVSGAFVPGTSYAGLLKNNIVIMILCIVIASPIGTLIKTKLAEVSERSTGAYNAVNALKAVAAAAVLALSYILLAAETIAR